MDQGDYFYANEEDADLGETNCEEVWREEMWRKNAELTQWLDEFMESEEFAEYLKRRRRMRNKKIQIEGGRIDVAFKGEVVKCKRGLFGLWKKRRCEEVRADQEAGIKMIRNKIYEARKKFTSRPIRKSFSERNDREAMMKILKDQYGFDLPWLSTNSKLIDRVLTVEKKKAEAAENKRRNTIAIIEKLLGEFKYEKARNERKERVWNYKKSEGRIIEDMEIIGSKVTVHDKSELEVAIPTEKEEEDVILGVANENSAKQENAQSEKIKKKDKGKGKDKGDKGDIGKKKKEVKEKGDTKEKKPNKDKDKKDESQKAEKKSKKETKNKEELNKILIPEAPIMNPRHKIEPENWDISRLLKDVDRLQEYLADRKNYEIESLMLDRLFYEEDRGIEATPSKIVFKNFINFHSYQLKVQLKNTSDYTKKLRFDKVIWNADVNDDLLLEVDPIGIQKLITGMPFSFHLRFNPETLQKSTEAKVVFLTYKPNTRDYRQYVLHVVCTPFCSEIIVTPTVVSFESVPIWRARNFNKRRGNYKTLKITNSGSKECRIVITKIFNPITVEHEWRNIISIMSIDDSSSQKITSSDLSLEDVREDRFPRNLVEECVENAFNTFRFDRTVFNVPGHSEKTVRIWLRNFEETGFYVETYTLSVYERYPDDRLYCIGNQDLVINAELSGHFLQLLPDLLDFEVCVFDSVYQLGFQIYNPTNIPHNVKIKLPASLRGYLTCAMGDVTIQPGRYHRVFLKFSPRSDFVEYNQKFYDNENDLFEFPIYVVVYTRNFEDTPPMVLDTFAVLTHPMALTLIPQFGENVVNLENETLLDLGQCSTSEAVFTEIKIQNTSLAPQQYAFMDLPECVTIQPNFGFGYLQPLETKTLRLFFQPTKHDLENLPLDDFEQNTVLFSISANTVKNLGSLKKKLDIKRLEIKLKRMENIVKRPPKLNQQLEEDIQAMCSILRSNTNILYPGNSTTTTTTNINEEQILNQATISPGLENCSWMNPSVSRTEIEEKIVSVVQYDEPSEMEYNSNAEAQNSSVEDEWIRGKNPSNRIWLKATILNNLCEFSQQVVCFPDTPCGSYSVASVELKRLKCAGNFKAKFEIFGNSEEIVVEPNIGELNQGETVNIYLISRPEIPHYVIEQKAAALKVAEAIEAKRKEFETRQLMKTVGKQKGKDKKNKKSDSEIVETIPEFEINEKDVVYGYFDYYPAEMCVWRNLEPYFIEADFCCKITYPDEKTEEYSEKLFLKAKCRVVRPNFIHDLNLQEIDFGGIAVGMSRTKIITLQNIQHRCIAPTINPLNPCGPFSTSELRNVSILPEYLLKIPITYTPQIENVKGDIEFFEIVCESTTYPLLLKGKGYNPAVTFTPEFTVARITGADCTFEIINDTKCPVEITFTKTCELDGIIQTEPTLKPKVSTGKKNSSERPSDSSKKPKKEVAKKRPKFSDVLMEDEIYSLEYLFEERNEILPSLFRIISGGIAGEVFEVPASSKSAFKIKFGLPDEAGGKKGKAKKEPVKEKSPTGRIAGFHVAKYVVTLGKREFLKEFIVIGS